MPDSLSSSSRGTLIAIGAAARIDFLYRLVTDSKPPFGQVVLTAPDPAAVAHIRTRFPETSNAQIIPAALGDRDGQVELLQYNFPGLTSLHPPGAALRDLFPGLRIKARKQVQILSAGNLMKRLANAPRPLNLFIDAPGSELDILQAFQAAGALDETRDLRIWCSTGPLFDTPSGAPTLSSVRSWLEARYFRFTGTDEQDPDWHEIRFTLNQAELELDLARTELETLRESQAMQLSNAQDLEDLLDIRDAQISELEAALSEAQAPKPEPEADPEIARQIAALQSDLALALRLQAIAQADLEDLRGKYRENQGIRASQEDLLRQLTPRLHQAAQQLRAIAPDLDDPASERLASEHTAGKKPKPAPKSARKPATKPASKSGRRQTRKRGNDN